jgi:MerR family transcriptional regulator, light-induced transcriptional regulator
MLCLESALHSILWRSKFLENSSNAEIWRKQMATIVDFSEEPKYTIKTVCTQTGIRAVTLRAWERRHEVLTPHRSDNRYRLYSERDVAILRWIKSRVDNGISISSAVSELRTMNKNGIWPEAIPTGPAVMPTQRTTPPDQYARQLFQALVRHNEPQAGDLLREAHALFDLTTICMDILTPALIEIGEAWYHGDIRVTTEHFASSFVRGKLLSMLQAYPSRRNSAYIMLGAAPTEQHEIGSLMMSVLLRSNGFRVEYLGPDIPLEDLLDYASYEHPDLIILTASLEPAAMEMMRFQEKLAKLRPVPQFAYAGRAFDTRPDLRKKVPGAYLGSDMAQAVINIRAMLSKEKVVRAK